MRCREYRERVTIQNLAGSATGGSRGQTKKAFADTRTVWAALRLLGGRERELARQIDALATHQVAMHYQGFRLVGEETLPVVDERSRLKWTDPGGIVHYLGIESVENVEGRDRELLIRCREVKP